MTQEESMLLSYIAENFDTERIEREGIFVRTTNTSSRSRVGDIAGNRTRNGYKSFHIINKRYLSHRLVWLWVNKEFPNQSIDHINGERDDNRINNLRDVTNKVNHQNTYMHKTNTSGACGVSPHSDGYGWEVNIHNPEGGKFRKYLSSKADAIECAKAKYIEYGYSKRHGLKKQHG